jgi:hypothetical protein
MLLQFISGKDRKNQVRSGYFCLFQVRSVYINLGHVKSD